MLNKNDRPEPHQDEIDLVLKRRGVQMPDLERLARLVTNMREIEWKLARKSRPPHDDPAQTG